MFAKPNLITIFLAGSILAPLQASHVSAASQSVVLQGKTMNTVSVDQQLLNSITFTIPESMEKRAFVIQWTMKAGSDGRPILSGNQYRLVNLAAERGITREKRPIAANLGWLPENSDDFNVLIKRQQGDGQIAYGDQVALHIKTYGWLRYKKQKAGINISDDNNNPHYIWTVGGGQSGQKLAAGMPFSLYNTTIKTEMMYCKRTHGIDLGWYGKSTCDGFGSVVSGIVFGDNGLFSGDGLTGRGIQVVKSHLCELGVGALAAGVVATTGGAATPAVAGATPFAIKECEGISP